MVWTLYEDGRRTITQEKYDMEAAMAKTCGTAKKEMAGWYKGSNREEGSSIREVDKLCLYEDREAWKTFLIGMPADV